VRPYRFHPQALAEYEAATNWYIERSYEGALSFAALVEDGIRGIRAMPAAWPFWPGRTDVRRRVLRRGPYSIVFLDQPAIVVVALAHQRRRPGYWFQRLRP
jgi:plasmid stabilization system protein ParE